MNYKKIEMPEMYIMGIAVRTTNEKNQAAIDIPQAWDRFRNEQLWSKIPNPLSDTIYGLYTEYEGDHTKPYTLVIGLQVAADATPPEGFEVHRVPASTFAVQHLKGLHPQTLLGAWMEVWSSDLPRTFTGDLEVYGHAFQNDPPELELLVAVRG